MAKRTDLKNAINALCSHAPLGLTLLALIAAPSCGREIGSIQVQGNPTLTVTVDTAKLEKYFQPYCTQLLIAQGDTAPTDADVQGCTNTMIANFLAQVQGEPTVPLPTPSPSPQI